MAITKVPGACPWLQMPVVEMVEELQEELQPPPRQRQPLPLQLLIVSPVGLVMVIVMQKTMWPDVNLMVVIAVNLMLTTGGTITAKELMHVSAKLKLLPLPPPRPRLQPNLLSVLIFGKMMDIVIPETIFRNVNMTVVIAAINLFLIWTLIVEMIATVSTNQSLGYGIFL